MIENNGLEINYKHRPNTKIDGSQDSNSAMNSRANSPSKDLQVSLRKKQTNSNTSLVKSKRKVMQN